MRCRSEDNSKVASVQKKNHSPHSRGCAGDNSKVASVRGTKDKTCSGRYKQDEGSFALRLRKLGTVTRTGVQCY